jgi:APA family basic amino acid/polyamine antiporter
MVPFVPIAGIACCLMLMLSLPVENWMRLFGWLAAGMVIYFAYGARHSALRRRSPAA